MSGKWNPKHSLTRLVIVGFANSETRYGVIGIKKAANGCFFLRDRLEAAGLS
jgi:hypothetical protein